MERIRAVGSHRANSPGSLSQVLSERPTEYHVSLVPEADFLVIPEVSSGRRQYLPIGWLQPPSIPSNKLLVVEDARLWQFAPTDLGNAHGMG